MRDLQAKHKEWCSENFPVEVGKPAKASGQCVLEVATVAAAVGKLAHHALKSYQGVRGDLAHHTKCFEQAKRVTISRLAYLDGPDEDVGSLSKITVPPLLGVIEEVGELVESSVYSVTRDGQIDAVGDIVLYLMDFCNKVGIDFEDAVRQTAAKVHERDWNANSLNGEVE